MRTRGVQNPAAAGSAGLRRGLTGETCLWQDLYRRVESPCETRSFQCWRGQHRSHQPAPPWPRGSKAMGLAARRAAGARRKSRSPSAKTQPLPSERTPARTDRDLSCPLATKLQFLEQGPVAPLPAALPPAAWFVFELPHLGRGICAEAARGARSKRSRWPQRQQIKGSFLSDSPAQEPAPCYRWTPCKINRLISILLE